MTQKAEPPDHIWRTLPGRVRFDYEVDLKSFPNLGSVEAINDYVNQRKEISKQVYILYAIVLVFSFFTFNLISNNGMSISIFSINVENIDVEISVVSFFLCIIYNTLIYRFMSLYSVSMLIDAACENLGLQGEGFLTTRWDATNLWVHALRMRSIGYVSGRAHFIFIFLHLVVSIAFVGAVFSMCVISTYFAATSNQSAFSVGSLIGWLSFISVMFGTLFSVVYFFVPFKFSLVSPPEQDAEIDS